MPVSNNRTATASRLRWSPPAVHLQSTQQAPAADSGEVLDHPGAHPAAVRRYPHGELDVISAFYFLDRDHSNIIKQTEFDHFKNFEQPLFESDLEEIRRFLSEKFVSDDGQSFVHQSWSRRALACSYYSSKRVHNKRPPLFGCRIWDLRIRLHQQPQSRLCNAFY